MSYENADTNLRSTIRPTRKIIRPSVTAIARIITMEAPRKYIIHNTFYTKTIQHYIL